MTDETMNETTDIEPTGQEQLDAMPRTGLVWHYNTELGRVELHDRSGAQGNEGDADPADVFAAAGVTLPAMPKQYEQRFDVGLAKKLIGWGIVEGISSVNLQSLLDYYVNAEVLYGGVNEASFKEMARGKFTERQQAWLVEWYRQRLAS